MDPLKGFSETIYKKVKPKMFSTIKKTLPKCHVCETTFSRSFKCLLRFNFLSIFIWAIHSLEVPLKRFLSYLCDAEIPILWFEHLSNHTGNNVD